jgi:hypothetical protein
MLPSAPVFSSHNDEEEPWRLTRLIRTDARVRELLRILTPEEDCGDASVGKRIWTRHVVQLHDDRGRLRVHVSEALGASGWLAVIALALSRAWNSEDESDIDVMVEGEPLSWPVANVLSPP